MGIYGPNSEAVEEVLSFVKSGRLLSVATILGTVKVARELSVAKRHAWDETSGIGEYTWTDLREREMAKVKGEAYGFIDILEIRDALAIQQKNILIYAKRGLREEHAELLDDVVADVMNCALKRAVRGRDDDLLERILQVYLSGGWPCGWDGECPSGGQMVAYYPAENVPEEASPHNHPSQVDVAPLRRSR